jgi:hypothetical protein
MEALAPLSLTFQIFSGCLTAFSLMMDAKNFGSDAAALRCMLKLNEYRLRTWAQNAGLINDHLDERLNKPLIDETLAQIKTLLSDAAVLKRRYNLEYVGCNTSQCTVEASAITNVATPNDLGFLNDAHIITFQIIFSKPAIYLGPAV